MFQLTRVTVKLGRKKIVTVMRLPVIDGRPVIYGDGLENLDVKLEVVS